MTEAENLALQFVTALTAGNFAAAHSLLTAAERERCTVGDLERAMDAMIPRGSSVEVAVTETLEDWLGKEEGDVGWFYVSILTPELVEAVAVIVTLEQGALQIREVQWGRP